MESNELKVDSCAILVVDDDAAMRNLLVDEFQEEGYQVIEACDGQEALSQLKTFTPDMVVTDLRMPFGGFDYLHELRAAVPRCPIILVTAFGDSQTKGLALECGVSAYFDKPMRIGELKDKMRQVLGTRGLDHKRIIEP
jgi:DNA-binding response OmpR family regulator